MALAEKFHFGEADNLPTRQETPRHLSRRWNAVHHDWRDGDTANICIGQGEMAVTPMQMAVAYSAIANGGTVFWPRLVSRIEPQDPRRRGRPPIFPPAWCATALGVSARSLKILRDAMLGETEERRHRQGGAACPACTFAARPARRKCRTAPTGLTGYNYWFASFAPYENPHYAVVVMVQIPGPLAGFGGSLCAPIAHDIYEEILKKENARQRPKNAGSGNDEMTLN